MLTIRPAVSSDTDLLLAFIRELADYEREPDAVIASAADLLRDGFGEGPPYFRALIAEVDGAAAGIALYFFAYSTWRGRPSLYLEDLFVRPAFRRHGIGRALMRALARECVAARCDRFQWQVLDWNRLAIEFYDSLGAKTTDAWKPMRLDAEAIARLARED